MKATVPVVDVFAGCGGLSEGFVNGKSGHVFKIALALDSDAAATETHRLRAFFHEFATNQTPPEYYAFVSGEISLEDLYAAYPAEAAAAERSVRQWELGSEVYPDEDLHRLIGNAVVNNPDWVLVGGPPCQAYSVAGRSRRSRSDYDPMKDQRNFLYREYLKILARHRPAVFVMENVPGMLNAKIDGRHVWQLMIEDLIDPSAAVGDLHKILVDDRRFDGYHIYSLVTDDRGLDIFGVPQISRDEYVVRCEEYGIPQRRHRVLLFGVRADIECVPKRLLPHDGPVSAGEILSDLPRLRSGLSKSLDTSENWLEVVRQTASAPWINQFEDPHGVVKYIKQTANSLRRPRYGRGGEFVSVKRPKSPVYRPDWFSDPRLGGTCNHETRSHMESDLHRYMFAACYAKASNGNLRLDHMPSELLPEHKNVNRDGGATNSDFSDRFAVQQKNQPSRTVVSHIAKDGHYYIHYDPSQCRSLTVREAARLQTFPDNFFFMGNRTEQYRQVGNAVPPLLSAQVSNIVEDLLIRAGRIPEDIPLNLQNPKRIRQAGIGRIL